MKGGSYLLPALFKTVLLPPLLTQLLIRYLPLRLPILVRILISVLSLPLSYILRTRYSVYRNDLAAHHAGARPIPKVRGRYPLNVDIMLDWARSGSEEEVGRMMVLLERKYGVTYNTRVLGEDQILTSDPRVIRHALIDEFDNFVKGYKTRSRAQTFLGDGIFNTDGDRWRFHRSTTRPFFHPTHVSPALFAPHISATLSAFPSSNIKTTSGLSEAFDMQEAMGQLALHMAIDWLCGVKFDAPHTRGIEWDEARKGVGEAMRAAQTAVGRRMKIGTAWPFFEINYDPLAGPMRTIHTFFRPLILEAISRRDERRANSESQDEKMRLIDRLVESTNDLKLVEDQLINILLASRDTTASLLTFCVYALALHPEVFQQVKKEILAIAGLKGEIDKKVIRDCQYTRRFINETLRLFPPVPLNIRRTLRPSLLPTSDGGTKLYMPRNTALVICTVLMQRDKKVWGEDAEEFRPERWDTKAGENRDGVKGEGHDGEGFLKGREGFAAWNLGPRMCLGQPFALTATHTFLILLIRHLASGSPSTDSSPASPTRGMRIELAPDAQPEGTGVPTSWIGKEGEGRARGGREKVWVVADVVLAIKGGLWVRFVK